jgi:hypothetical protein
MKTFTTLTLLALALPAQAQLYRCADAKGKVFYSDKPLAGCKALARRENAPAPARPAAKAATSAPAAAKPAAKKDMTAEERSQYEVQCRGLEQERAFLARRRDEPLPGQEERLGQVERAIARECR